MPVYSVTYDLNKPGQNYSGLIDELKAFPSFIHLLKSEWLIGTNETPDQVFNRLGQFLDKGDRILIVKIVDFKQGWLTEEQWDWINQAFRTHGS
jgi:hypothetical protein